MPPVSLTVDATIRSSAKNDVFLVKGRAKLPRGVPRRRGCTGRVVASLDRGDTRQAKTTTTLRSDCSYAARLTTKSARSAATGVFSVLVRFVGNRFLRPEFARNVLKAIKCAKRRNALLEDAFWKADLKPKGFERSVSDHTRAYNPEIGQNAAWDAKTWQWIDTKTGKVLGGCGEPATAVPPPPPPPPPALRFSFVDPGWDHTRGYSQPGPLATDHPSSVCTNGRLEPNQQGVTATAEIAPAEGQSAKAVPVGSDGIFYVRFGINSGGEKTIKVTLRREETFIEQTQITVPAPPSNPAKSRDCP